MRPVVPEKEEKLLAEKRTGNAVTVQKQIIMVCRRAGRIKCLLNRSGGQM